MVPDARISEDLARVAQNLSTLTDRLDPHQFTHAYLGQEPWAVASQNPEHLAQVLAAHLALGGVRQAGHDLVRIVTPQAGDEGRSAGASTLVLVVTDDRPFIVDTATMILAELGWSTRELRHPILDVRRDDDGVLTQVGVHEVGDPDDESWLAIEAYPPLGAAADERAGELAERLRAALGVSRAVADDRTAMLERLSAARALLDATAQPTSPGEVREATDLLDWLGEAHFEFFGYREYTVSGGDFTPVEGSGLGVLGPRAHDDAGEFHAVPLGPDDTDVLVLTKDSRRSPLHRPGFLDYVGVRRFDRSGAVVGELRFVGLLAEGAYAESPNRIPLVRRRVRRATELIGIDPDSHSGQAVHRTLATFPRDQLFEADAETLARTVAEVVGVVEARRTKLLLRRGRYGRFWSCLVYLPRDRYRTVVRERIEALLMQRLGGTSLEFTAAVTESPLARLLFVVKQPDGADEPAVDAAALEREIVEASRVWDDDFNDAAADLASEARGVTFGEAYEAAHTARQAVADLMLANQLEGPGDLRFALYRPDGADDPADLRFKVITRGRMSLSRVMPHLDALGIDVIDERPFHWDLRGEPVSLYDFGFRLPAGQTLADWGPGDRHRFAEAFAASYQGRAHAGKQNRLVMSAGLTWEQVTWLRGISRYLQQAGTPFSQPYVAAALNAHPAIAAAIVAAFEAKFAPSGPADLEARATAFEARIDEVLSALDAVDSLDHDRILRMFVDVLRAIQRTNAFAEDRPALAFKIAPRQLSLLPEPRPAHEIFVYSPRVQGVHLRYGSVARGGLRWSDRAEDFRTEVLGLVKAQMVKNTVIVPVGAKGGFVPQNLPDARTDRAAWLAEGVACYEIFIGSLLSVTDNLVDGQVVPPRGVVRHDGDDTYLVVAADKGTATFSDIANRIAVERGFWLGDAFASGGSVGYDHKGMGITARGAWESVKRHFYELGVDCQAEDFTCVGIGDMAGDVFGNGMLLSRHTRLVAAFNHLHVFLDPTPDAAASFAERQRLFDLPRSSWADYDTSLISAGGGVYPRTAKAIAVTPQVREALGLDAGVTSLTPNEMIRAILTAPVDLLWNGGIGTYVRASDETDAHVGDKANDAVRVTGAQVRARVAGEGGNLGWTQAGRIEFAASGGRINTDFIDNSAGVDTSDHEVNIKVLLAPEVAAGRLDADARVALLASMTDDVATLVLAHNVDQNLALSVEQAQDASLASAHEAWMRRLEDEGLLDRVLEDLPSRDEMQQRIEQGRTLSRPELASLLAWTKIHLERQMGGTELPDDPYLADRLVTYFPKALRERHLDAMQAHPLRRDIVTMVTVNRFVNSQGITAFSRLATETSSDVAEVVRAQLAARTIFQVARHELALAGMGLPAEVELRIRVALQQMIERATRWLLHNRRGELDIKGEAAAFTEPVAAVLDSFEGIATQRQREQRDAGLAELQAAGVEADLARVVATSPWAHQALSVVELAGDSGRPRELAEGVYFALASQLGLDRLFERVNELDRSSRWDTMARAALRDDLQNLHAQLTQAALAAAPEASDAETVVATWAEGVGGVAREAAELAEITGEPSSLARMSVALRTVRTLLV